MVEDDPEGLKLTVDLVGRSGYLPLREESGEAALALLAESSEPLALALIDIVMAGMSGMELYREISVTHPDLPVIFITGYDGEEFRKITQSKYMILQKPFTPSELLKMVLRILG